ncbi:hypothetical protein AB7M29_006134 [Pseudomonas sp. F-14 TE3623]
MASRKTTAKCDFSYEPEEWALYGVTSEKRVEFVAGNVDGSIRGILPLRITSWRGGSPPLGCEATPDQTARFFRHTEFSNLRLLRSRTGRSGVPTSPLTTKARSFKLCYSSSLIGNT